MVRAGGKFTLPLGSISCYRGCMKKSTGDNTNTRKRASQTGEMVGVRLQPDQIAAVDRWRSKQPDLPTRPEAIRRLVEKALAD